MYQVGTNKGTFDWCLEIALTFLIAFDCRVKRVAITERDNLKAYCGLWCSVAYSSVGQVCGGEQYCASEK